MITAALIRDLIPGLTARTFLEYYAVACIVLMPAYVFLLIYIGRKTTLLKRFNAYIDGILGLKEEPAASPQAKQPEQPEEGKEKNASDDEKSGITRFRIYVGDKYYCRVSSTESSLRTQAINWYSENEFVGTVEKKSGVFTANKNGRVKIYYEDESGLENGVQVYDIEVMQKNPEWFADKVIEFLYKEADRDTTAFHFISRRIIRENVAKHTVQYEGKMKAERRMTLQFDGNDRLQRALWELDGGEQAAETIQRELEERFEYVPGTGGISIWVREAIDGTRDDVEVYCFLKRSSSGALLFGIGRAWREYGDIEEFLMNIAMCERLFSDCLGKEPESAFEVDPAYFDRKRSGQKEPPEASTPTNMLPERTGSDGKGKTGPTGDSPGSTDTAPEVPGNTDDKDNGEGEDDGQGGEEVDLGENPDIDSFSDYEESH